MHADDVKHFGSILPHSGGVLTLKNGTPDDLEPYNTDWMQKYRGQSQVVLRPKTTQQVSDILRHCNERR